MSDKEWYDKDPMYSIPRDAESAPCKCGGYMDSVDCTVEECREFGCGRDTPGNECCARAFVCRLCGARRSGMAEAPDMDFA